MICAACGGAVEPDADLCLACGEPIGDSPAARLARAEAAQRGSKKPLTTPPPLENADVAGPRATGAPPRTIAASPRALGRLPSGTHRVARITPPAWRSPEEGEPTSEPSRSKPPTGELPKVESEPIRIRPPTGELPKVQVEPEPAVEPKARPRAVRAADEETAIRCPGCGVRTTAPRCPGCGVRLREDGDTP